MDIDRCDQCLKKTSEFREHSANSWMKADAAVVTQEDVCTLNKCKDEYSESSPSSSSCVGKNVSVPKFSWFKSMSQIVGLPAAWHQDKVEGSPREQALQAVIKQTPLQFTQSSTSFYETVS